MSKPTWWNPSLLPRQSMMKNGPVAMLLNHAVATDVTIFTGTCRGLLEDDEEAQKDFHEGLEKISKGKRIMQGGPIMGRGSFETWFAWDGGAITLEMGLDGKVTMNLACLDEEVYMDLAKFIGQELLPDHVRQPVYALAEENGQIGVIEVGIATEELEAGNYTQEVVDDFNFIVADLRREKPTGRLSIFDGEPGTGKTFLVRGIMHEVRDAVFVLVPSDLVEKLAGPKMIPMLVKARNTAGEDKPLVLIIEDADRCLMDRESASDGSVAAISALLNLSDGILGHALDIRVVATTNASLDSLDPALRRPGRLSKHCTVGPLDSEQAAEVYSRITEGDEAEFGGPTTLGQVYSTAKEEEIKEDDEDQDDEDQDDEFEDEDESDDED